MTTGRWSDYFLDDVREIAEPLVRTCTDLMIGATRMIGRLGV
jgi:hypothetical protein